MFGLGSGKIFTHNQGFSCAFRQWEAQSHCRFLHGYALQITLEFVETDGLSKENWVMDFGGLHEIKNWLAKQFDHKTIVAKDDPYLEKFRELHNEGVIDLVVLSAVGCEAFCILIKEAVQTWLNGDLQLGVSGQENLSNRIQLSYVKVAEHESNYAFWSRSLEQA